MVSPMEQVSEVMIETGRQGERVIPYDEIPIFLAN